MILEHLQNGALRQSEVQRQIIGISNKMLTQAIRDLEKAGLIARNVYLVVPPKVEYSLTKIGLSVMPNINDLAAWGRTIGEEVEESPACSEKKKDSKSSEHLKRALCCHLARLHTTDLGMARIKKNLSLPEEDVVEWCRKKICEKSAIVTRKGKNWYVEVEGCQITVNAHNYTIITAHKKKG